MSAIMYRIIHSELFPGVIPAIMYWRINSELIPKGDPFTIMYRKGASVFIMYGDID